MTSSNIPRYIEDRIRLPPPPDLCIVRGSTPVVSFGNAQSASVATLGLNPSRAEFVDKDGVLLEGQERRLATHSSLGIGTCRTRRKKRFCGFLKTATRTFREGLTVAGSSR